MTTSSFFCLCKRTGLTLDDMEILTIGDCLDYVEEWISQENPNRKKDTIRQANQSDFDKF